MAKIVNSLVQQMESQLLQPRSFFVAWCGVLTLAFDGFPPEFIKLKQNLSQNINLFDENNGSKWPKMTLGCLLDHVVLNEEEYMKLFNICKSFSDKLCKLVRISCISNVSFNCRSLENISSVDHIFLLGKSENVSLEEDRLIVDRVLAEMYDATALTYLDKINQPGNRNSHYSDNFKEDTLCAFVSQNRELSAVENQSAFDTLFKHMEDFQKAVEVALPGKYRFFSKNSLHVTIRSLKIKLS